MHHFKIISDTIYEEVSIHLHTDHFSQKKNIPNIYLYLTFL